MKDLTDAQILHHLKQNTVSRNEQLSVLVNLLNSIKENAVLAIDGAWGSGKTVFIKQLLMLADNSCEDYGRNALDNVAIEKLRASQKAFYFNAWENVITIVEFAAFVMCVMKLPTLSISMSAKAASWAHVERTSI